MLSFFFVVFFFVLNLFPYIKHTHIHDCVCTLCNVAAILVKISLISQFDVELFRVRNFWMRHGLSRLWHKKWSRPECGAFVMKRVFLLLLLLFSLWHNAFNAKHLWYAVPVFLVHYFANRLCVNRAYLLFSSSS